MRPVVTTTYGHLSPPASYGLIDAIKLCHWPTVKNHLRPSYHNLQQECTNSVPNQHRSAVLFIGFFLYNPPRQDHKALSDAKLRVSVVMVVEKHLCHYIRDVGRVLPALVKWESIPKLAVSHDWPDRYGFPW